MICILHGYLLEGSGSNLWTREMVRSLCRDGATVHLVCQENRPEAYDFIAAAYAWEPDGTVTVLLERDTPYPGRCVMHKPRLGDMIPVYVGDRYDEFTRVVPMVKLSDDEIEAYLARNVDVVGRVVRENGITAVLANHAVLMSVVAQRVKAATGVPFAVMPHGSAIEYAVRKDARFHALASGAFDEAARIFCIGEEMHRRIPAVFPDLPGIEDKLATLNLGVDTSAFAPVARRERRARIGVLLDELKPLARGKPANGAGRLCARLRADMDRDALLAAIAETRDYAAKLPDDGLEESLGAVDWEHDSILLFVGRLIAGKGLQAVIAALPAILERHADARLIVVGHGPLREAMEALLWALEHGARGLAEDIARWGSALEGRGEAPFAELCAYFGGLDARGGLAAYFETARRVVRPDRVIFTGYLKHGELRHLFPCCDVAVFPSVVAEAGPLVFLEALAAGCFPMGTYFGGMAASIDAVSGALPTDDARLMRLRNDPAHTVADIAANTHEAFGLGGKHAAALRRVAVERYDWRIAARRLADELAAL